MLHAAHATAHSNIALVKYWGKREGADARLNLPAVGSLSLTLDALRTETTVVPRGAQPGAEARYQGDDDTLVLDGNETAGPARDRVVAHLDLVWRTAGYEGARPPCRIVTTNHFPTAAGLASSASGFAALTVAATAAFDFEASPAVSSELSRMGSGSAARSVFGGFVRLDRGERSDGADCIARPLLAPDAWDVRLLVAMTARGPKPIGSTDGMRRSRETSPYYGPWVSTSNTDLDAAEAALQARDLEALGKITEASCFKMHACMMATDPPLLYWNGATVEAIQAVWRARAQGLSGYVTIDAGPHVKVLCTPETAEPLAQELRAVPGVLEVLVCAPGPDATVAIDSAGGDA